MKQLSNLPSNEGAEFLKKQTGNQDEQAILANLTKGKYIAAEGNATTGDLSPEAWEKINTSADTEISKISPESPPTGKKPMSGKQASTAVEDAKDSKIIEFGKNHVPYINATDEGEKVLLETKGNIELLLDAIKDAKENARKSMMAKPVSIFGLPILGNIYGLIQGRGLKQNLRNLEGIYKKLQDPKNLNDKLKADKISPNAGHVLSLAGGGLATAGWTTAALGGLAAAPVTASIGMGIMLTGGISMIIGTIKQIFEYTGAKGTYESLEALEKKVFKMQTITDQKLSEVEIIKNAYKQGVRANVQMMN